MPSAQEILARFRDPDSRYRSLPFWAWNSKMEKNEIVRQIRGMHKAGIGGFFMHSRDGLETPYMGEEWFAMIRAAALEAEALGMEAWLYDEDRWPSGTAGGSVPAKWGDMARCKGLTLEVCGQESAASGDVLAAYAARLRGIELLSLRRLKPGEEIQEGETLLLARLEVSGKSDWFNGEAPPDNLNPEAVRKFLEATHDRYKAAVGDLFGKTVPGIFTDEPSLHDRHAAFPPDRGWIPWTCGFGEFFRERRGYDPLDSIPYLYFSGEKSPKIRHDYWWSIAECYSESYSGEIARWCRENGISYTGHFLQEDKLGLATRVGGAIMPHYRYQDMPGIDILCERTDEYLTVKQCSSVANQYGKPMVLSETFGCTGWELSFEGQKWVGDWQFALGVNRLSKHMALYTLKGCGKRDYPPSLNYQNSWWEHSRQIEDYFARLSAALIGGAAVRDVLVLHPASTAWARLGCDPYGNPVRRHERDVPAVDRLGDHYNELLRYLSGFHYDYDLGDEMLIARDGAVRNTRFVIGRAAYQTVILPLVDTLLASTVGLLEEFLRAGGSVITLSPLPNMIEGESSESLQALLRHPNVHRADSFVDAGKILEGLLPRRVSITEPNGGQDHAILCLLERQGDSHVLFLANNDRERAHAVDISLGWENIGAVTRLDLLTGEFAPQQFANDGFADTIGPADSRLYLIEAAPSQGSVPESGPVREEFFTSFPPECTVRRTMPNALTLDRCRWRFANGAESAEMEVWLAQKQLREALGMGDISHNGMVQRYQWIGAPHPGDGAQATLTFAFRSSFPAESVALVLESPQDFTIRLNGAEVPNRASGWYLDRDFARIPLPRLQEGENLLELSCAYKNSMQLEDCYLTGDFGVSHDRVIMPENPRIRTGDWTLQGYPHYAGSMIYSYELDYRPAEGERLILKLGDCAATTVVTRVNGAVFPMPWKAAACADITDALSADGKNRIEIEIVGSPRNLMGPFHLAEGKPLNTHDASFRTSGREHVDGYNLHPYGLLAPPRLYLQK